MPFLNGTLYIIIKELIVLVRDLTAHINLKERDLTTSKASDANAGCCVAPFLET